MNSSRLILPGRSNALSNLNRILNGPRYKGSKFFLLVDENSYENCLPVVLSRVTAFEEAEFLEVPVGEECKSLEIAAQVWGALLESGADRNTILVCIGGGCVSDLGGLVAAGYKRGIRHINIPTTLIGMVDAAIGGKTAVNLEGSKNQVGFFHMPELVCICPELTDSLPDEELINGLYEVIKTLAVADPEMYDHLITTIESGNVDLSNELITTCAEIKSAVVKQDPNDHGIRHILNFGHTFGHAIEVHSQLRHGEAVGVGMLCAMYLSVKKMGLDKEVYDRYRNALKKLLTLPKYSLKDTEAILALMRQDKKNRDGLILCVLLQEVGVPVIDVAVDENEIRDTLLNISK